MSEVQSDHPAVKAMDRAIARQDEVVSCFVQTVENARKLLNEKMAGHSQATIDREKLIWARHCLLMNVPQE